MTYNKLIPITNFIKGPDQGNHKPITKKVIIFNRLGFKLNHI